MANKKPSKYGKKEHIEDNGDGMVPEVKEKDMDKIISRLMDKFPSGEKLTTVDTGSISLNKIFGGGLPLGKYIEIHSLEGVGKSTIALFMAVNLARQGYRTVFLDVEKALNESLLDGMGALPYVEDKRIIIHKLSTFKDAEEILDAYLDIKDVSLFIIDSITALLPMKLQEKSIEEITIGAKAQLQAALLEKYKGFAYSNNTSFIWLNQMRNKIDLFQGGRTVAAGGFALKYYSDIIINLGKAQAIKKGDQIIGTEVVMRAEKNKFVAPYFEHILHIIFGKGVSNLRTVTSLLMQSKHVKKDTSWFKINGPDGTELKFLGAEKLVEWVKENFDYAAALLNTEPQEINDSKDTLEP